MKESQQSNLPPFYVGQKVVCLKSATNNFGHYCVKDHVYTVLELNRCKCGAWKIDIGVKDESNHATKMSCGKCKGPYDRRSYAIWADATNFAPIHEDFQQITLSKVIEIESSLINVN